MESAAINGKIQLAVTALGGKTTDDPRHLQRRF